MVDDLILPVESLGVRVMSIGFLTEEDSPVIWRGPMLHKALTSFVTDVYWDEPDYLLVDLPPGTGDVSISIAQLLPTASMLIVTTPQLTAQRVARRAAAMAARVDLPVIGVIETCRWWGGSRWRARSPRAGTGGFPWWPRAPTAPRPGRWWRPPPSSRERFRHCAPEDFVGRRGHSGC
jgi:ATP-binding protein involved in chromosome partitioning